MSSSNLKYAFATGHEKTSEVAETILQSGGNAFDAAVASYLASFVTEPVMASAGAGGFAQILTSQGDNQTLDFFCQTPKTHLDINPNYNKVPVDFGENIETFYTGAASMAVPGAMALISYLNKHYCTIPIGELIKPAQTFAVSGIRYTPFQSKDTLLLSNILLQNEEGKKRFLKNGKLITTGDLFTLNQYADFLESFAKEKDDWFYKGEIAKSISKFSKENNGSIRYTDFEDYEIIVRKPYQFKFKNKYISTAPLPSLGGALMKIFLDKFDKATPEPLSEEHLKTLREAFASAIPFTSDSKKLFEKISQQDQSYVDQFSNRIPGGTSHFNIIDKEGNAIALSTSIGVGSGYFIEGTDMQMNNMLGEPALMPNGLDSWKPNVRLNSMMSPSFCFDDNLNLELSIGTGGSTRIPFSISQVLINKYILNLNLNEAIHLPRIYENEHVLYIEDGYDQNSNTQDKPIKLWPELDLIFGGTHTIDLKNNLAIGDQRREGSAKLVLQSD